MLHTVPAVSRLAWAAVMIAFAVILGVDSAAAAHRPGACDSISKSIASIWPVARAKAAVTATQTGLRGGEGPPTGYPMLTVPNGQWSLTDPKQWTSGFLSAYFWQMASIAKHQTPANVGIYQAFATRSTLSLGQGVANFNGTHDVGFLIYIPFRNAEANGGASAQLRSEMLIGAKQRFARYNPHFGKFGGFPTGSSSLPYPKFDASTIIDDMINLELILGAAVLINRLDYFEAAVNHARSMAVGHVGPNGFVHHDAVFNKKTGKVVTYLPGQGASSTSDWARGHAWAVYGFTMVQRYMRGGSPCAKRYNAMNPAVQGQLLATTVAVADRFLLNLPEPLQIPPWDFSVKSLALADRDSSAAAIVASGLVELDGFVRGRHYFDRAARIIQDLSNPAFLSAAQGGLSSILKHGTLYRLHGSFNTGTIWGDYYLLEALDRSGIKCM